jgi:hypothetical protein
MMLGEPAVATAVVDIVTLTSKRRDEMFQANATINAMGHTEYPLPDGSRYSMNVGILGLGRRIGFSQPPSLLQQLKSQGRVASMSLSLHMGSVALEQSGSLVLGGYERNRALGPVGVSEFDDVPYMFLIDVILGTQVGASPFSLPEDAGSVWQGIGDNEAARVEVERLGAKKGTAVVFPNPAVPYIYLPTSTCEAAARRLPVTWNARLGLYFWNADDPAYERIVRSPAYLAFVFSDRSSHNITIKVPFRLLNLTLEAPLVQTPIPYFPCKPVSTAAYWMLGRAFLQAAFVGVDQEQNVTFLAQAHGSAMEQSVIETLRPGDKVPQTNPIEEFERSWFPSWTVLQEETASSPSPGGNGGLSTGSVAGIVVGVVATLAGAAVDVCFLWRRKAKPPGPETENREESARPPEQPREMAADATIAEIGKPNAHEMWCPPATHELSNHSLNELPGVDERHGR